MMARRRRLGRVGRTVTFVVLIGLVIGGFALSKELGGRSNGEAAEPILIEKGSSVGSAANALARANVIGSARLFRLFATTTGRSRAIKPGRYQFSTHASYNEVLTALVEGRGIRYSVTVPEGYDVRMIAPLLAKVLSVSEDSVRAAVRDTAWRRRLNVPAPTLEGYLFPATYSFADGTSAREAVVTMLERFEAAWKPEWNDRLQDMAISRHDAMTMAAIVEKEARKAEERPIIAAVYWNRVKKGMKLQADPTVQFALPQHVERVLYKDLEVDSKYNTYKYAGLPPGPIASPGEAAIVASLTPASVPYLYFVAHPDGHHEFRNTHAEHLKAIAYVKSQRRAATPAAGSEKKKDAP
ncbi:MAG: endolytic transglycosylase MltG [Gemmatimonadaceae bacterium]|nr:endolytic transglycosylase MltG [Gemmatimonadaceae bacterium]